MNEYNLNKQKEGAMNLIKGAAPSSIKDAKKLFQLIKKLNKGGVSVSIDSVRIKVG